MTVTVALVKKLILQFIGGKRLQGNIRQVFIDGRKAVVQRTGVLSSISGVLGSLTGLPDQILSQLVSNPMGMLNDTLSSLSGDLLGQIEGLSGLIPPDLASQLTGAIGDLDSALSVFSSHTNILSGITQDLDEIVSSGTASLAGMMQLGDTEAMLNMSRSLFSGEALGSMVRSLDPSELGGVTELLSQLEQTTDLGIQRNLTQLITREITDMGAQLTTLVGGDREAFALHTLNDEITERIEAIIPETRNPVFDLVASEQLLSLAAHLPEDGDPDVIQ